MLAANPGASHRTSALRLDLTGVTMIDAAGKGLLAAAHAQGAELVASGCLMRAIVAELTALPFPAAVEATAQSVCEGVTSLLTLRVRVPAVSRF